jgi:hypothetical protein
MKHLDRWLLLASYILLTLVVAGGAWYLTDLAEQASEDRCRATNIEHSLLVVELATTDEAVLEGGFGEELIRLANERTEETCAGTGIEPARLD